MRKIDITLLRNNILDEVYWPHVRNGRYTMFAKDLQHNFRLHYGGSYLLFYNLFREMQ